MSDERERNDRDDDDLQELKRRRTRHEDDDDRPRGRSHKAQPHIEKFQIWFEFNKSTVTADYVTEGEFNAEDLERFVDDLISDDFRLYRKKSFEKKRENYGGNERRWDRSRGRGRGYYED